MRKVRLVAGTGAIFRDPVPVSAPLVIDADVPIPEGYEELEIVIPERSGEVYDVHPSLRGTAREVPCATEAQYGVTSPAKMGLTEPPEGTPDIAPSRIDEIRAPEGVPEWLEPVTESLKEPTEVCDHPAVRTFASMGLPFQFRYCPDCGDALR